MWKSVKILFWVVLLASNFKLAGQRINLVAGGPGEGRLANEVDVSPSSIAVSGDGTIYLISDSYNAIRKIDLATGIVSRYAGNGAWGDSKVGANAVDSPLTGAQGLAVGPDNRLYFVDNNSVKKVDGSGVLQLVAGLATLGYAGDGGLATQAKFRIISSIAFGSNGDLFVADFGNNRIRKVESTTGIVTTIAGNGTAGSNGDGGLAINASLVVTRIVADGNGNLFVVDFENHRVRKINLSTGIITTVAGSGTAGFSGDGGVATSAQLSGPTSAVVVNGVLYIADAGNSRIRQVVLSSGIISSIAGTGASGSNGDGGPALSAQIKPTVLASDPAGNLLFSEYQQKIRKIAGGTITTIAGRPFNGDNNPANLTSVKGPWGIARATNGDIYFADQQNNRIRKIDHATGSVTTIAGNGTQGYAGDGGPAIDASLNYPRALAIDGAGDIFFSEYFNNVVRKINMSTGVIKTIAGTGSPGDSGNGGLATSAQIGQVNGMTIDGNGNIFITTSGYNKIKRIDHLTQIITTIAGTGTAGFSGDGGPAINAQISAPEGISIGPDGNIYFCDMLNHRIRKIDQNGVISSIAGISDTFGPSVEDGTLATSALLPAPSAIGFDSNGNLFIGDYYHIYRIDLGTGKIFNVAGAANSGGGYSGDGGSALDATVRHPEAFVINADGELMFTDPDHNVIRKITPRTLTQAITFNSLTPHAIGDQSFPINSVTASSSASLPLTFSSSNTSVATVSGNLITITGVGNTDITASQPGNVDYLPASPVVQQLIVTKRTPAIALTSVSNGAVNTSITLTADSNGSTGNVSYSVNNGSGSATLFGNVLKLNAKGTVTVTATITGDANYLGSSTQQVVTITNPVPPINFTNGLTGNAGTSLTIALNPGSSTGAVTFTEQDLTGKATLAGSTLSLIAPGQVRITAAIAADANYSATTVSQIFTINNSDGTPIPVSSKIYGSTFAGGSGNAGTLFQMNGNFTEHTLLKEFSSDPSGSTPSYNDLTEAPDGKLYGLLPSGGTRNAGVLYSIVPSNGTYAVLHNFVEADGSSPSGKLTLGSDGKFYGMTSDGGANGHGVLFQYDYINNIYSAKKAFDGTSGYFPGTALTEVSGILYGVMNYDDVNFGGSIFSYKISDGAFSVLVNFTGDADGGGPSGYLTLAPNNKLYGFTSFGGSEGAGTIFEYDINAGIFSTKVNLDYNVTGVTFNGGFTLAPNAKLYSAMNSGGPGGWGSIVEYDPGATTCVTKYDFLVPQIGSPAGSLCLGTNGKLFALATQTGVTSVSTIYEYTPGLTAVLMRSNFNGQGEVQPTGAMTLASNGKMYGLTSFGGAANAGTLFEFDPATFSLSTKKEFTRSPQGLNPTPHIVMLNNRLFGVAEGGSASSGVIYEYDLTTKVYTKTVDLSMATGTDVVSMIAHSNGKIYLVTTVGPSPGAHGTIIEYDPTDHQATVVHTFATSSDPFVNFIVASRATGKIYGTTSGTAYNLFEFDPVSRTYTVKLSFDPSTTGSNPGALTEGPDQMLYGVCSNGGANSAGTIFRYSPVLNQLTKLADFSTATGRRPVGALVFPSDGKIYGIASSGGQFGYGTLYQLDPASNVLTKKQDLQNTARDAYGTISLALGANGKVVGSYFNGGTNGYGSLYEFDQINNTLNTKFEFTGTNGQGPNAKLFIARNEQSIVFNSISDKTLDIPPFSVTTTSTSGLPILFASNDPAVATVSGNTITLVGAGYVTITATQPGGQDFVPAQSVARTFAVSKAPQTITFADIGAKTLGDLPFSLTAMASSGLPIVYSTSSDKVTISSFTVTLSKAGTVFIKADQGGNATYNAAPTVEKSFCVNPPKPMITTSGLTTSTPLLTSSNDLGNQWLRNGTPIAGATDKTFTASTAGVYTVITTVDNCASATSDQVSVIATGLSTPDTGVTVYPNPVQDELMLTIGEPINTDAYVSVTDMLGKVIYSAKLQTGTFAIDARSLTPGIYIARVAGDWGTVTKTFVKLQ